MSEQNKKEPSFSEVYLSEFIQNNPHAEVSIDSDYLIVENPWMRDDVRLKGDVKDSGFIEALNNLIFRPKFDAVFHIDINSIEFVYAYLDPSSESNIDVINRSYSIFHEGANYECCFSEPSERLMTIARSYEKLPSDSGIQSVPQLIPFRDQQNLDSLNGRIKKYFESKVPRSFYIKSDQPIDFDCFETVARQINFLSYYYDRNSPLISINSDADLSDVENTIPIRYSESEFPEVLISQPVDDIVMKLIEVARESQPRFAFLYYYQVFEYAGYYYIDEAAKRQLRNYLKDPALINYGEDKISELFAVFADLNHNDDVKMKRVIEEHCDPKVIWKEVENDLDFFSKEHTYEGGFTIKALVSTDTTVSSWESMWMPKLYDHLTKIRNSLVHARERRENKVILPGSGNNLKLRHYIPLIRRVAEQIALKAS